MCTGRLDLAFVLRAFIRGAHGVLVGGCWPGECHYATEGNYDALSNMYLCRKLLAHLGVAPERLRLEWVSASQGARFAEVVNDFSARLKKLGPLGSGEGTAPAGLKARLEAAARLVPYIKLVEREKLRVPVKSEEAYREFYASEEADRLFKELIADKLDGRAGPETQAVDLAQVDAIIDSHEGDAASLIQILLDLQAENRWLPGEALERVAERLRVPMSRVRHVATFYKAFSLVPKGRHRLHVCMGTACHVRGAGRVLDAVQDLAGIRPGETDEDLRFSLETVNCLGCCALGPVMEVDGKTHGRLSASNVAAVLGSCK